LPVNDSDPFPIAYAATHPIAGTAIPHAVSRISGTVNNGTTSPVSNPTYSYDDNGAMLSGGGRTYTYGGFSAPLTINNGGITEAFQFDAEHRRTEMVVETSADSRAITTTDYIAAQGVRTERWWSGSNTSNGWRSYIEADGRLVAIISKTGTSPQTNIYVQSDHLGSAVAFTEDTGTVLERDAYDAWGARKFLTGGPSSWSNRSYTGQEYLSDSALIHMNARTYDSRSEIRQRRSRRRRTGRRRRLEPLCLCRKQSPQPD